MCGTLVHAQYPQCFEAPVADGFSGYRGETPPGGQAPLRGTLLKRAAALPQPVPPPSPPPPMLRLLSPMLRLLSPMLHLSPSMVVQVQLNPD